MSSPPQKKARTESSGLKVGTLDSWMHPTLSPIKRDSQIPSPEEPGFQASSGSESEDFETAMAARKLVDREEVAAARKSLEASNRSTSQASSRASSSMDLLVAAADSTLAQTAAVPSTIVSETLSFTAVASSSKSTIKPKVKVERYVLLSIFVCFCLFFF